MSARMYFQRQEPSTIEKIEVGSEGMNYDSIFLILKEHRDIEVASLYIPVKDMKELVKEIQKKIRKHRRLELQRIKSKE